MEFNLADLFESVVDVVPEQPAIIADARRLTYAELDGRANRLAHHLASAGVGPGDRVGLQLANGSEYLEGMLACFKIRAVPVNVNYRYVTSELRYLYQDAGLVGLVFHSRFAPAVSDAVAAMPECRTLLEVHDSTSASQLGVDYERALAATEDRRDFASRSADDLYCVYTGGTTGMPKGVLWRHEDIFFAGMGGGDALALGNVIGSPEELATRVMRPGMTALPCPPFMHSSAHWLAFTMLFGGGKLVTLPAGQFDPVSAWRLVGTEAVNILVVVGDAMARPLLDELDVHGIHYDISSLVAVGSGGAVLSPATKQRLAEMLPDCIVADAFGSSETGLLGGRAKEGDPFGTPRLHVDKCTDVLDDALQPVARGSSVVGRLARSGHIPLEYLGDADKTAATFVESAGTRWALPGDMAMVETDGAITVLGRGSLCINTGGEKVFPDEVEAAMKTCADIEDVVVVGVSDERYGEQVVAVVQPRAGCLVEGEALRTLCREKMAGYKVPRQVVMADAITRSPSGKADYRWAKAFALRMLTGDS
ncbi:MAG TPA: acyl-CoA synthetase [Acidimicrobiales bacterium]|nr:acyl-CoA synthetase [Acidimicrobiales bacterium]